MYVSDNLKHKAGNTQGIICPLFIMLEAEEIIIISKTSIHSRKYGGTFSAAMDVEGKVCACVRSAVNKNTR